MNSQPVIAAPDLNALLKQRGFSAYKIKVGEEAEGGGRTEGGRGVVRTYDRKSFYKICLHTGKNIIHYADRSFETEGPFLFFGNPHIPYSAKTVSATYTAYACLFTADFLRSGGRSGSLQQSPLFKPGGTPVLTLTGNQPDYIASLFGKMIAEQESDYAFKDELIRNYVQLLIHEAVKMQPSESHSHHKDASSRITAVFFALLERQFPIERPDRPLQLSTAQDFATNLSVHINYLNRCVKKVTGKPTTAHIAERIICEARSLLLHTDWNIADIAYALGFEYPTYFSNYFKRMTGSNPGALRAEVV